MTLKHDMTAVEHCITFPTLGGHHQVTAVTFMRFDTL